MGLSGGRKPRSKGGEMTSTVVSGQLPFKTLIADDTDVVRESLRRLLESIGHTVDVVMDGLEAVEAIRIQPYHLVLLDIQMPRMGGIEVAFHIGGDRLRDQAPWVVAMSGASEPEIFDDRLRFDRFLQKPIRLQDLKVLTSEVRTSLRI